VSQPVKCLIGIVVVSAACGTPRPQLLIDLAGPPSQACPSTECSEVPLTCDAVMGIRVFDPKDTDHLTPLLEQCKPIQPNGAADLCAYRTIDLDPIELPIKDLEVQVTVYPLSEVEYDVTTKKYVCPPPVAYSAINLPIEQAPTPALGGRGFYHPGDEEVRVTLGCTNLNAINRDPSCAANQGTQVTATVNDFTTRQPIEQRGVDVLRVAIGEPRALGTTYVQNPIDEVELHLVDKSSPPSWAAEVDQTFNKYVCLDVLEFGTEVTPVLQCTTADVAPQIDLRGVRLHRRDLRNILEALSTAGATMGTVPEDGLTIGIVLDQTSRGAADYVVDTNHQGTVTYLSGPTTFGGSKTSNTGIFVSTDAPFGTRFTTTGARPTLSAIGGNVAGKITIVILPPAGSP